MGKKQIYSMWPHWEGEQIKGSSNSESVFRVLICIGFLRGSVVAAVLAVNVLFT